MVLGEARQRPISPTFSQGRRWTATGVLTSSRGPDEGSLPEAPAANDAYSFILLHPPADKRSGRVSGARRGGQERKNEKRARSRVFSSTIALPSTTFVKAKLASLGSAAPSALRSDSLKADLTGLWLPPSRWGESHLSASGPGRLGPATARRVRAEGISSEAYVKRVVREDTTQTSRDVASLPSGPAAP